MRGWRRRTVGAALVATAACATTLVGQSARESRSESGTDPCSLASNEEFQQAHGVDPRIGIIPDVPVKTEMSWGPHCDYTGGAITLYTKKSPAEDLDRLLTLTKADKERVAVAGLGKRAFFTVVYPDNVYKRQGLLAVYLGPRVVSFTMDAHHGEPIGATKPRLETLAKLVLPRLQ